jgi:hypothetical protein
MFFEKGMLSPELTEAALAALAPEMMDKIKDAQQASSVGPLPDNVAQALSGQPVPPAAEGEAPAAPAEEAPVEEAPAPTESVETPNAKAPTPENFPELFGPPQPEGETSA